MPELASDRPSICFVGLQNLPVLAAEYSRPGIGGAERQQTLLARALVRQGFDVSMVVNDYGQADGQVWDGITTFKAYRAAAGIPMVRFFHPRWSSVWSAMRRADADVYYVSCAGMLIGEVALFARWYGRKAVFRVSSNADCDAEVKRIRHARDRVLYRYGIRNAHLILAQTAMQESLLRENFGCPSRVVPSLSELGGARIRDRTTRDISVLWLGNIRQQKRADRLLDLARRMPSVQFDMVGGPVSGSAAMFDSISNAARALPNVRFHGFVPYQEANLLYERARVFVNTSEMEGFPNTYMQAWASGTPVVAFFDPDDVIAQKRLGCAAGTLDEMHAAVAQLLEDDAEWDAASARCRAHIDAHGDESSMLKPYVEAFRSLQSEASQRTVPGEPTRAARES